MFEEEIDLPNACNISVQGNWYVISYTNNYGVKVSFWALKTED